MYVNLVLQGYFLFQKQARFTHAEVRSRRYRLQPESWVKIGENDFFTSLHAIYWNFVTQLPR